MLFANDTEEGLRSAAALVNTEDGEQLPDVGSLHRDEEKDHESSGSCESSGAPSIRKIRSIRGQFK